MICFAVGRQAFVLATMLCAGLVPSTEAQVTGFAPGRSVVWQLPEDPRSDWRGGSYAGVIERVDGGDTLTLVTRDAKWVSVKLGQLTAIDCNQRETWRIDPTGGGPKNYMACLFEGAVRGRYAVHDWGGGLRVRLHETVLLRNKQERTTFAGLPGSFGKITLGDGRNQWAKGGIAPTPSSTPTPTPTPAATPTPVPTTTPAPGGVTLVPEIGQAYKTSLKAGYPSVVEAYMDQSDYDWIHFEFPGGSFHAHSVSQLNLVADLLDGNGKMIVRQMSSGGGFRFDQPLPMGSYSLMIRVMYHGGSGAYTLTLGTGGGQHYRERR